MTVFDGDYVYDIEQERGGRAYFYSRSHTAMFVPLYQNNIHDIWWQDFHLLEPLWVGECLHAQLSVSE